LKAFQTAITTYNFDQLAVRKAGLPPLFCAAEQSFHFQHFTIASARFTILLMRKQILLLLIILLFPVVSPAQQQSANQLDVPSLLREVEAKQKQYAARAPYSYTLKRTMQDVNDKGEVKKEKGYIYQVFPLRQGLPAMLLLSEDGKPLSGEKLAREKIKTNKYWQEHKNDAPKNSLGEEVSWFAALDHIFARNERYEGRDVVVLSFTPRAEYDPKTYDQKFVSGLKGEVWIEPVEKVVVKIHGELTSALRSGGLSGWLSSLRPGSALTIDFAPVGDGLWAVKRIEFASISKFSGILFFQQTAHSRLIDEISDYHPFDPDTKDLFARP
jgi:hypothetical protein